RSSLLNLQVPIPSTKVTAMRINWSATRKKTEAIATITNTMAVVIAVSRRDGQVTLRVSSRTSWRNLNGDVAINEDLNLTLYNECQCSYSPGVCAGPRGVRFRSGPTPGRSRDSNPKP